ncbi:MAG: hypothetical protein H0U06_13385, partial [Solirubrobacterales bacterium]|nr:hypothetical protein [Solirubrobacterales bacterium]
MSTPGEVAAAVAALDELTRRLRRECPWDREQDERTIVPHTVEEAYELAAAANSGDDAKLLDELGDVLFQVHFLALLLEERGAGTLADVADHCRRKLIRRHPHVFPDQAGLAGAGGTGHGLKVESAGEVLRNWDAIKATEDGREPGIFGEVPENLPGPLFARKLQRRAASTGFDFDHIPYEALREELGELEAADDRDVRFREVGDVLFQVHFLALLLEERGAGTLADVADHCRRKLIRRHPHVFPDQADFAGARHGVEVESAGEVLRNWDAIKATEDGREPGIFGEVPENLPGPLFARKLQR